ncbi:hypothetical protein PT277_03355 [Acetobacteraceae bacterium ESL0709]|nr:hypothetical protein [Acetobacteraceae bacterium ESL0697]MDF7677739.1 hypothetical protein [Acetobacteraceae bacterium ESL0709]
MSETAPSPTVKDQDLETRLAGYRHNLRNKLSPAVMVADYLCHHHDPEVSHQAEMIMASLEATLDEIRQMQASQ